MTGLLVAFWFFGTIAAVFFIFKPNPKWAVVANRKRAFGMAAAIFFITPMLSVFASPPTSTSAQDHDALVEKYVEPVKTPEEIEAERIEQERREQERILRSARSNPEQFLELTNMNGYKGGFDTVLIISGTLKNTSPIDIKDPTIECSVFGPSGTELGKVRNNLYENVAAGGSHRFRELNMGFVQSQWSTYSCHVRRAVAND